MIEKEIFFNDDASAKIKAGVNALYEAVSSTLGPSGQTVIIEDQFGQPHVTKDGITVAESIVMSDPVEHLAMATVRQASKKTALRAGDGTTSSVVLASNLIMNELSEGHNPHDVKKGMITAKKHYKRLIQDMAQKCEGDTIKSVATISANNDPELGGLIAEAFEKLGSNGVVSVDESYNEESYLSFKEGTKIDRGWASHHLITHIDKREFKAIKPLVLICADEIQSAQQILPVLEFCAKGNHTVLIVADTSEEFVATMILNNRQGKFKACVVNPPGIGYKRDEILEDLALMTNATVFSSDHGGDLSGIDQSYLGTCDKLIVSEDETVLFTSEVAPEVDEVRQIIREKLEDEKNEDSAWHLRDRLAKLTGGVATVHVGANTEVEMKEKKDRVDDAIAATRSALRGGVIPGGSQIFWHLNEKMRRVAKFIKNESIRVGYYTLMDSTLGIGVKILKNAGYTQEEAEETLDNLVDKGEPNLVYNVKTKSTQDMFESGVIDPAEVAINVLENAVSVSCELLTTNCVIANKRA